MRFFNIKNVLIIFITILFVNVCLSTVSMAATYNWSYTKLEKNGEKGKIYFLHGLGIKNLGTTEKMTVTSAKTQFYVEGVLKDTYNWTYSGIGKQGEHEPIYERPITTNYVWTAVPTVTLDKTENLSSSYKATFKYVAKTNDVKVQNVITMIPTEALLVNPWVEDFTVSYLDGVNGVSAALDTNLSNYDIATMEIEYDDAYPNRKCSNDFFYI